MTAASVVAIVERIAHHEARGEEGAAAQVAIDVSRPRDGDLAGERRVDEPLLGRFEHADHEKTVGPRIHAFPRGIAAAGKQPYVSGVLKHGHVGRLGDIVSIDVAAVLDRQRVERDAALGRDAVTAFVVSVAHDVVDSGHRNGIENLRNRVPDRLQVA